MYILLDSSVDKLPSKIVYVEDNYVSLKIDYEELLLNHYKHQRYSKNPQSYIDVRSSFLSEEDVLVYRYRIIYPRVDSFVIKFCVTKQWELQGTSRFNYKGNEYYLDLANK